MAVLCCHTYRCHRVPTVGVTRDVLIDALQANLQAGATIGQHLQAGEESVKGRRCTRGVQAIWQGAYRLLNMAGQGGTCWQGDVSQNAGQDCRVSLRSTAVSCRPKHLAVTCPIQGCSRPRSATDLRQVGCEAVVGACLDGQANALGATLLAEGHGLAHAAGGMP